MDTTFRGSPLSRRNVLKGISSGFGYLAFAGIAAKAAAADQRSGALSPKQPHFAPKAKRVIFLCMNGAPSHVDLLDPKPALSKANGQTSPRGLTGFAKLMGSPWRFSARGKSGTEFSELLPNIGSHADELCVIRSMQTDLPTHGPASIQLHTGSTQFIRPSIGAWSLYGLGSEAENLPGFINLSAPIANGGAQKYGSAFLPAVFQGTPIGNLGPFGKVIGELKIENARNSRLSADQQRLQIDFIQSLNQQRLRADAVNPHIEGMIESLELGFRMQGEIPRLLDLTEEKPALLERYGVGIEPTDYMGRQCLLARRFAEAGVRFIEVNHGDWDDHRGIFQELPKHCSEIDKPVSALLTDLQERGLLQETLVIWGG